MPLNFEKVNNIFLNSREEELGIAFNEKDLTQSAVKSFIVGGASEQYDVTTSFAEVTGMSVTHESRTGKVLVIYTSTVSTGIGEVVNVKLQKDTVDITGTEQTAFNAAGSPSEGSDFPMSIHHAETKAGKNTWRIMAKRSNFTPDDCFINDRILTIIDI